MLLLALVREIFVSTDSISHAFSISKTAVKLKQGTSTDNFRNIPKEELWHLIERSLMLPMSFFPELKLLNGNTFPKRKGTLNKMVNGRQHV